MNSSGFALKGETGSRRIELECEHQSGVLYVVPSEASWVCGEEMLHVHSLAGFLRELTELDESGSGRRDAAVGAVLSSPRPSGEGRTRLAEGRIGRESAVRPALLRGRLRGRLGRMRDRGPCGGRTRTPRRHLARCRRWTSP